MKKTISVIVAVGLLLGLFAGQWVGSLLTNIGEDAAATICGEILPADAAEVSAVAGVAPKFVISSERVDLVHDHAELTHDLGPAIMITPYGCAHTSDGVCHGPKGEWAMPYCPFFGEFVSELDWLDYTNAPAPGLPAAETNLGPLGPAIYRTNWGCIHTSDGICHGRDGEELHATICPYTGEKVGNDGMTSAVWMTPYGCIHTSNGFCLGVPGSNSRLADGKLSQTCWSTGQLVRDMQDW